MNEKKLEIIRRILEMPREDGIDEVLGYLDDIDEFYTSRDKYRPSAPETRPSTIAITETRIRPPFKLDDRTRQGRGE